VIDHELLGDKGILVLQPKSAMAADDFRRIATVVDPYILENGKLTGLLIEVTSFPGWESLSAMIEHMKFVKDHQRRIDRVAVVTDSHFVKIAPKIASHFAHPAFRVFAGGERQNAMAWLEKTAE